MLTTLPSIRLNPAIKISPYRDAYLRDGFVQIPDIFEPQLAEALGAMIDAMTLDLVMQGEDGPVRLTPEAMAAEAADLEDRLEALNTRSGTSYGFLYEVYPLISAYVQQRDPGHPVHRLTEWLNGEFARFGAMVTDQPKAKKADGQITRYRPGHYIGLHDDSSENEDTRLTAYTLGFTKDWRTDWGGQLLFHSENGDVLRGFAPRFNTLTLFKVPTLHSVAPVAPYAQGPRHSVVGWLRTHV